MKFGGSSVANAENINKVIDIVLEQKINDIVIVVSALGGITDNLVMLANLASKPVCACGEKKKNEESKKLFESICERHDKVIGELIVSEKKMKVLKEISKKYGELEEIIKNISGKELSKQSLDAVMSFGELLSSFIISEVIRERGVPCEFVDSRDIIKTDNNFGNAEVDIKKSYQLISEYFSARGGSAFGGKNYLSVMGGFIASTKNGETTTLSRGGSDYTASLVGAAVDASVVEIWTDVDGLMTADPRKFKDAVLIPEISYEKAEEMALAGAKVIHPRTMKPAKLKNIIILIKNTFNPKALGTKIFNK